MCRFIFLLIALVFLNPAHSESGLYIDPEISGLATPLVEVKDVRTRLLLAGDLGAVLDGAPILSKLQDWAERPVKRTTTVFLGDNLYEEGLPNKSSPSFEFAERPLRAQMNIVEQKKSRGIFVPGNHDWLGEPGKPANDTHCQAGISYRGADSIRREANYVNTGMSKRSQMLPHCGCPGPASVDLDGVRVIVLDTEWWLREDKEKPISLQACPFNTERKVIDQLIHLMNSTIDQHVIVVAHHPLVTYGPHGGVYSLKDKLIFRGLLNRTQDLKSERYRKMISALKKAFSQYDGIYPLIYASGHEHSLQVIKGDKDVDYFLVSGAGTRSRLTDVGHESNTLFAHSTSGFMVLDYLNDGRVVLHVVEADKEIPSLAIILRKNKY